MYQELDVCTGLCTFDGFLFSFLASRLQQSNIAQPSKKNTKLQGHTWDVAKFDKVILLFKSKFFPSFCTLFFLLVPIHLPVLPVLQSCYLTVVLFS